MYVKGLAAELQKMGVENVVAAPALWKGNRGSRIEGVKRSEGEGGVRVWRFRCRESGGDLGEIYGEGDPVAAESFKQVLDEEKPDIVHFHAWSPAVSILLVREVKRRGIRIVQTYHTPTLSCPRGTLMRWGKVVCDGNLAERPCVPCAIQGKLFQKYRIPDAGSRMPSIGKSLKGSSLNPESKIRNSKGSKLSVLTSKLITMLRMPGLIRRRTEAVRELFRTADKIVALNQWTKQLLRVNGVEEGKVELITSNKE